MQDSSTLSGAPRTARHPEDPLAGTEPIKVFIIDVVVAMITFAVSLGVLWLAIRGGVAMRWALLLHVGVVCIPAAFFALRQRRGGDLTIPTLLSLAALAGGPMGAAAAACAAIALWRRGPSPLRLRDWYDYIMGVVERSQGARLYDELAAGRTPIDHMARVPYFTPILKGTSVDEQQRALGVIGRRFHSDFRPVLRLALRNRDGLIRAQAAAIASRLDLKEKSLLWSQDAALDRAQSDDGRKSRRWVQDAG
jgi:hypothetical protein